MIRHLVFFKVKQELASTKTEVVKEMKRQLDALPALIPGIKDLETGVDFLQSPRSFDLSLITAFETVADLDAYRIHPKHLKVVEYIKTVAENTVAVDYDLRKYDPKARRQEGQSL